MTQYAVYYASAGCLPDGDGEPPLFDTVQDAAQYVWEEWRSVAVENAVDDMEGSDHRAILDLLDRDEFDHVVEGMGADDPRPNSLYSWSIEEVEES